MKIAGQMFVLVVSIVGLMLLGRAIALHDQGKPGDTAGALRVTIWDGLEANYDPNLPAEQHWFDSRGRERSWRPADRVVASEANDNPILLGGVKLDGDAGMITLKARGLVLATLADPDGRAVSVDELVRRIAAACQPVPRPLTREDLQVPGRIPGECKGSDVWSCLDALGYKPTR